MSAKRNFTGSGTVLCLLAWIAWAAPAEAFRMIQNTSTGPVTAGLPVACNDPGGFTHWTIPDLNWFHNTSGQGAGKAAALQSAMQSWTNVPGTSYSLSYAGTTGAGFGMDNQNTLIWATGNGCTGSCLALTMLVLQPDQVITESDITFNASVTWTTNGSNYDTESVAAHEFGHSLGIHHTEVSSSPLPTMFATYFGADERTLENDDWAALQCSENRYPTAQFCTTCPEVALQADNGQWWVAEGGGGGIINANRNGIGAWEVFRLVDLGGGNVALQCVNGQFVVAEGGGGQELRCNRNGIGGWETFTLHDLGGGSIALQCANGQFVVAEGGGGREVLCNRYGIGAWETFFLSYQ